MSISKRRAERLEARKPPPEKKPEEKKQPTEEKQAQAPETPRPKVNEVKFEQPSAAQAEEKSKGGRPRKGEENGNEIFKWNMSPEDKKEIFEEAKKAGIKNIAAFMRGKIAEKKAKK